MFKLIIDCECNDNTTVEEFETYNEAFNVMSVLEIVDHYQMRIEEAAGNEYAP